MKITERETSGEHELLLTCTDEEAGYHGVIAVHSTALGPALGGVLNDETIPRLKSEIVAGAANNQLLEPRHGTSLEQRGILYAPDYVANAGGIINGCVELLD